MVGRTLRWLAVALLGVTGTAAAQGSISGRVTEQGGGPIGNARIQVSSGMTTLGATTTREDGTYRVSGVRAGSVTVTASRIGFSAKRADGVVVTNGGTATANFTLAPVATQLNALVTTTTRGAEPEKILDSPNSISVVSAERIAERPSVTVTDNLRSQPGLSISSGGLVQANIVSRGFNNAFSGSMLMLQDYRFAGVPSLRVNVPFLFTGTQDDVDRIEVLQGPASALYGPNSANGVLHVITKSPFTSKGTTITVDGGERSLLKAGLRHAGTFSDKWGYKVSGEYFRAEDWNYLDPNDTAAVNGGPRFSATNPAVPAARRNTLKGRNFDLERYTGEARLDWKPGENTELITSAGYTMAGSALEITTTFGAAQVQNWSYQNLQQRFRHKKFFAQWFYNSSNSGNDNPLSMDGTYYLRTGIPVVDKSSVLVGQLQQGFNLGGAKFVAGADYIFTKPRSEGTIFGRNEGSTDITEVGGYLQMTKDLTPKLELLAAVRGDQHNQLEGAQFSPRAALRYKLSETQNFRLTFNRAFNSPASFSYFLDQFSGQAPNLGPVLGSTNVQILGNPPKQGWRYDRGCDPAINGGLCMISPLAGLQRTPLTGSVIFPGTMQALGPSLVAPLPAPLQASVLAALRGLRPTGNQIGAILRNPAAPGAPVTPLSAVTDLAAQTANFSNTWEIGYKAVLKDRLRLAVDLWYQIRPADPTTQVVNLDKTAFFDPTTLGAYLSTNMGPVLTGAFVAAGLPPAAAQAQAGTVITGWVTSLAQLPAGTVPFTNGLSLDASGKPLLVFTYQNAQGQVDVRGMDLAADFLLDDKWSVEGTYSYLSRNLFPQIGGPTNPLAANAPRHRGSATLRYANDAKGYSAEVRGRYMDAFRVNSGTLNSFNVGTPVPYGGVPVNAFVDLGMSWKLPFNPKIRWAINGQNILDNQVASFVGVPATGRLVTTRLQYTF